MSIKRHSIALAVAATMALSLSACGSSGSDSNSDSSTKSASGPSGDPVTGGTGKLLEDNAPRGLDPAVLGNSYASSPIIGNALYGELMIDDPTTGQVEFRIAKDWKTEDGGKSFTLTLRDDVKFSDGTPMTVNDVKATWEHTKDPATASADYPVASKIASLTAVDDTTLKVVLTQAIPQFANSILQTGLNWIAPATSIAGGTAAINEHPIGAGPYTLESWARQDVVTLVRNDTYYGDKPYLDKLEIRYSFDAEQRINTLTTGGADLSLEGNALNIDKAEKADLQHNVLDFGGGTMLTLNNTKAPFDDIRARQGLAAALDLSQIDDAINQGTGVLPTTLFTKSSPFYEDIPLITKDQEKAKELFDALAADGKPLSFEVSLFQGNDALGASIQTQLAAYKNVTVKIKTIDLASYGKTVATKAFDAMQNSLTFGVEPEPRLWNGLFSTSTGNLSGVSDPELDKALDAGLLGTDVAARKAAYHDVQERLVDVVPVIIYASSVLGVMANNNVGGIQQYGFGSLLPETLWIKK